MSYLEELLNSIEECKACGLMNENKALGIPYVPINPRPDARIMFVGRDPSPRTAEKVGLRGGKSAFINEIYSIVDQAEIPDAHIYITDLCKCHWRTSVGKPLKRAEHRKPKLDKAIANACLNQWLVREIEILKPRLIVTFGEELYQILRPLVVNPAPAPDMLSATRDKSLLDAEFWFVENGPLSVYMANRVYSIAVLRHPGNSNRLLTERDNDQRYRYHQKATEQVIKLLKEADY
jgi:uracil-DNA glycosylase